MGTGQLYPSPNCFIVLQKYLPAVTNFLTSNVKCHADHSAELILTDTVHVDQTNQIIQYICHISHVYYRLSHISVV